MEEKSWWNLLPRTDYGLMGEFQRVVACENCIHSILKERTFEDSNSYVLSYVASEVGNKIIISKLSVIKHLNFIFL